MGRTHGNGQIVALGIGRCDYQAATKGAPALRRATNTTAERKYA